MAYNRLAGMIPEVWSGTLLSKLNDALVFRSVANTDYEGEIRNFGDTVKISEISDITVNSYSATSTGALTVQSLSDAQKQLRIDQAKYFAFWVDDLDAAQTKPKVMAAAMTQAAYKLAANIDAYLAALHSDAGIVAAGTSATGVDITSTNVMKYLSIMKQKLQEANVPEPHWLVVPPWFAHKMVLARIIQDTNNSGILTAGMIGSNLYGFNIYMSNNVVNGTPAADDARIMFGSRSSISFANQILSTESVRPALEGFKTLVKGLVVYGAKVVRPDTLGVLYADYTAEAT